MALMRRLMDQLLGPNTFFLLSLFLQTPILTLPPAPSPQSKGLVVQWQGWPSENGGVG
jgi:hypothetical protein